MFKKICYVCSKPLTGKGYKRWKGRNFCSEAHLEKYKKFWDEQKRRGFVLM